MSERCRLVGPLGGAEAERRAGPIAGGGRSDAALLRFRAFTFKRNAGDDVTDGRSRAVIGPRDLSQCFAAPITVGNLGPFFVCAPAPNSYACPASGPRSSQPR